MQFDTFVCRCSMYDLAYIYNYNYTIKIMYSCIFDSVIISSERLYIQLYRSGLFNFGSYVNLLC